MIEKCENMKINEQEYKELIAHFEFLQDLWHDKISSKKKV